MTWTTTQHTESTFRVCQAKPACAKPRQVDTELKLQRYIAKQRPDQPNQLHSA